jgi:hypothetical protein
MVVEAITSLPAKLNGEVVAGERVVIAHEKRSACALDCEKGTL